MVGPPLPARPREQRVPVPGWVVAACTVVCMVAPPAGWAAGWHLQQAGVDVPRIVATAW